MKKLLSVLLLAVLSLPAFAQGDRIISARQAITETFRVNTFEQSAE